jgi:hypothetical protein
MVPSSILRRRKTWLLRASLSESSLKVAPTPVLGGGIKNFKFSRAKKLPLISHVLPNINFNPLEIVVLCSTS